VTTPSRYTGYRPTATTEPPCPNQAEHTPCPTGYLGWFSWAEQMNRTHGQRQCEGCGRWAIWYRRAAGEWALCWGCGETKVDPKLFDEDEELLCGGCVADRAAKDAAARIAWTRQRWADAT